jgi:hypothetical protein
LTPCLDIGIITLLTVAQGTARHEKGDRTMTTYEAIMAGFDVKVSANEIIQAATPETRTPVTTVAAPIAESPKVVAENAKRAKAGRPKMTAKEAREFEMYSEKNASIVEDAAADRGCECVAYESIFTFNRWIAQGRVVIKGQKATFIEIPNFREIVDEKTGEKKKIRIGTRRVAVFCKCQTKKLEAKGRAA